MLVCQGVGVRAQNPPVAEPRVIASCDFEGPYSQGEQQIQEGLINNWSWGKKDMLFRAEKNAGRPGTVQAIYTRGISSGAVQMFFTRIKLRKDHYYKLSWWMKTDGLEGPMLVNVRKIGYPWTSYVYGWVGFPETQWRHYTHTGKCAEDVNDDLGVMWETGSMGTIWLDDLVVEESAQPFEAESAPVVPPPPGNLLIRSSCEGKRDALWSTGIHGQWADGLYKGAQAEWEDPQWYRAEGGKFGRYCMAVPASTHRGNVFNTGPLVDVIPGQTYTFSAWLRADRDNFQANIGAGYYESGGYPFGRNFTVGREWKRYSVTGIMKPSRYNKIYLAVSPAEGHAGGNLYVDGLQLEAGGEATDYKPWFPLELYGDVGQARGNLFEWGQRVPLTVLVAAADATSVSTVKVEIKVVGYQDVPVWRKVVNVPVNQETRYDLTLDRRGIFRVELRTVNASLAAPQELVLAMLPKPRPTGEDSYFGTHLTIRPFFLDYARRIGMKWTRFHDGSVIAKWCVVEPERGKRVWYDEQVNGIVDRGLNIVAVTDRPPKWGETEAGKGDNVIDVDAYGQHCEAVARHYRGRIRHWEIWNEPYLDFKGTHRQFSEVMRAAYAGFKRGDPDCKVLGWCADVSNPAWGEQLSNEARRSFDIFSFHNYIGTLCGGGTMPFAGELSAFRKLLESGGVRELWNTEGNNGAAMEGNTLYTFLFVTPFLNDRACAFASRVWMEHAKVGVSKFFVYQMHQTDSISYLVVHGGLKNLIGYDRSVTPAAVATAVTAYAMDGLKAVPCNPVAGVVQSLFEGDGRATWAVYDDSGVPGRRRLDLRRLPRQAEVFDVMGNDPRRDGKKEWEIGICPLFVMSGKMGVDKLATVGKAAVQ